MLVPNLLVFFPSWYNTYQGHVHHKGSMIFSSVWDIHGGFISTKILLGEYQMINNKWKLPYFADPDYYNSDQKLWESSNHQPFTGRIGNRKDIYIRQHIAIIEIILDIGCDFDIVDFHDNDVGLTNDTVQWIERDFWSKYRTSFCKKIGSIKFNVGAYKYHVYWYNSTVSLVLFKVPHGCKREYEIFMRVFIKAEEESPRRDNWAKALFYEHHQRGLKLHNKVEVGNCEKIFQISRENLQLHWTCLGWSSSHRLWLW